MADQPTPPPTTPSSSITSHRQFPPLSHLNSFNDTEAFEDAAATTIQRFLVKKFFDQPLVIQQLKDNSYLPIVCSAISALSSLPFREAAESMSKRELFESAAKFLASLPDDNDAWRQFPIRFRSARSLLSAPMLYRYPSECLGPMEEADQTSLTERKSLLVASSFVTHAIVALLKSVKEDTSTFSTNIMGAYNFFKFSLCFLASALSAWQRVDDAKVAGELVKQYVGERNCEHENVEGGCIIVTLRSERRK